MTDESLYDEAQKAEAPQLVRTNFGVIDVDLWRCKLVKGQGKLLWDPNTDSEDQKRTAIDLTLTPLASARFHDPIVRNLIAQSKEWTQIVRPSLEALKLDLRSLKDRWVQVEMVLTGRKYTNKSGEEKELTTFKFIAAFADEDACEKAAADFFSRTGTSASGATSSGTTSGSAPSAPDLPPTVEPMRSTAAKFLPGLWKASNGDVDLFMQKVGGNALTAKFFTLESPEIIAVVSGTAA